jgi:hypothetical protein
MIALRSEYIIFYMRDISSCDGTSGTVQLNFHRIVCPKGPNTPASTSYPVARRNIGVGLPAFCTESTALCDYGQLGRRIRKEAGHIRPV